MSAPPATTPPPPPPALPHRRARHALRYVVAVVFTLVVAVIALPDRILELDRRSPFAQIVSFRPWVLAGILVLVVLLAVMMRFDRRVWPFVAGALVVLLIGVGVTVPRTIAEPVPAGGTPLKVLAFNTYEGSADVQALAALIRTDQPDILSLEEAGARFSARLAPLIEPLGYRLYPSNPDRGRREQDVNNVTAVVSSRLGTVTVDIGHETSTFPYVQVTGGGLGTLRYVAFHSVAPVPGSVPNWVSDMLLLQKWCAGGTPAIVAGDFNATDDHSAFREGMTGCGDAALQRGEGLTPTWGPFTLGPAVRDAGGPQIDHVLSTGGITAEAWGAHDIAHSDHRAITATLRLPG
jgi:endonuclease/exonuclease/phosphatase (EEP) superfamily protein YafD